MVPQGSQRTRNSHDAAEKRDVTMRVDTSSVICTIGLYGHHLGPSRGHLGRFWSHINAISDRFWAILELSEARSTSSRPIFGPTKRICTLIGAAFGPRSASEMYSEFVWVFQRIFLNTFRFFEIRGKYSEKRQYQVPQTNNEEKCCETPHACTHAKKLHKKQWKMRLSQSHGPAQKTNVATKMRDGPT